MPMYQEPGVFLAGISGIECGKGSVSFEVFIKLCVTLKVNPDYLLGGTLRSSNIPLGVIDGLNQCMPQDQVLAADFIELLRKRNPENK